MASERTGPTAIGFGEGETGCIPRNQQPLEAKECEATNSFLESPDRNRALWKL